MEQQLSVASKKALCRCEQCDRVMSRHTARNPSRRTCATCVKRAQGKPITGPVRPHEHGVYAQVARRRAS